MTYTAEIVLSKTMSVFHYFNTDTEQKAVDEARAIAVECGFGWPEIKVKPCVTSSGGKQ